jgi:hypothetical protein
MKILVALMESIQENTVEKVFCEVRESLGIVTTYPKHIHLGSPFLRQWEMAESIKTAMRAVVADQLKPYIETINRLNNNNEHGREVLYNSGEAILRLDARYQEIVADQKRELDDLKLRLCMIEMKEAK